MIIVVLCLLTRLLLTLGSPAPIAVHLQARKLGDHDNPFIIEYNCEGCEEVCNANCMSILCFDGPNPVQEDANKISDEHRAQSHFRIFKRTQKFREDHGVRVSDEVLARTGNSAEENNNARTRQGGKMEMMTPVHATPNSLLGTHVAGKMKSQNVQNGDWFYKDFKNFGNLAPYCSALLTGSPKREEICKEAGKDPEDPLLNTIMRDWSSGNDDDDYHFHMMSFDKGDRWQPNGWGVGGSSKPKRATHAAESNEEDDQEERDGN